MTHPMTPSDSARVLEELAAKWRSEADDCDMNALEADSIGLNDAAKASGRHAKHLRECADELTAAIAAMKQSGWQPIATAPESTPLAQAHFLAYLPDDDWGPLGGGHIHVCTRYAHHEPGHVRPAGSTGERRALCWTIPAAPTEASR